MQRKTGHYVRSTTTGEGVEAFVPYPLPPVAPPLALASLQALQLQATQSLSRLALAGSMAASVDWLVDALARKEAVLSTQIEGTQATLVDLLQCEAGQQNAPIAAAVEEVCNYLEAYHFARQQLQDPHGLPLSMRLLNGVHRRLLRGTRGQAKQPGKLRRSQNWLGGTRPGNARFVPPPPAYLAATLGALETYIHTEDDLPPLIRIGLLHVQFETIHPYLDGNGRMGRLLISLLLEHWGLLKQPLLYLSLYFKRHRQLYYEHLHGVRHGAWEAWLAFFLQGVCDISEEARVQI